MSYAKYQRLSIQRMTSEEISGLKLVDTNVVKLKLLITMRVHPIMNINQVVRYWELVKRQKIKKPKLVEVKDGKNT